MKTLNWVAGCSTAVAAFIEMVVPPVRFERALLFLILSVLFLQPRALAGDPPKTER